MIVERIRQEGDPSMIRWFTSSAVDTMPEFSWAGQAEAERRIVAATEAVGRLEVVVFHDGKPAAICILVGEDDMHVGPCLSVMWHYVLPQSRGVGSLLLRHAYKLAKANGWPTLAYTRRTGEGEYQLRYRRVSREQS